MKTLLNTILEKMTEEKEFLLSGIYWFPGSGTNPSGSFNLAGDTDYDRDDTDKVSDIFLNSDNKVYVKFAEKNKEFLDNLVLYVNNDRSYSRYALSKFSNGNINLMYPCFNTGMDIDALYEYIKKNKSFLSKFNIEKMNKKINDKYSELKKDYPFNLPAKEY